MCGIAGWIGQPTPTSDEIERTLSLLRHRGPDGQHARVFENAGLLHTRLSIIDLSTAGDQPLSNEDGTVWVTFNGEIYNHQSLRAPLERAGHRFRGHSDSEILPHLYEEHGPAMFELLRGMFTIALLDTRSQRLLLARDRFGIKPLFFASTAGGVRFASELNALRALPGVGSTPDAQAIADYTALLFVPSPSTIFREIRALEPGCTLDVRLAPRYTVDYHRYHRWAPEPRLDLDLGEAVDAADALVEQAVARQLESDVPLGAMLSGGIDSGLVCAAAQAALPHPLHTFSVAQTDPLYDETAIAVRISETIGSTHEVLPMSDARGTWDHVADVLGSLGQPFADTSVFAVRHVSAAMRPHVTVALSGDGGDEAFGGYDIYWQLRRIARLATLPRPVWNAALPLTRLAARAGLVRRSLPRRVRDLTGADDTAVIQTLFSWIRADEQAELIRDRSLLPATRLFERRWGGAERWHTSRVERLTAHAAEINMRLLLADDYLFKVDAASMRSSLEVRVPLLDEDLVDFGLSLPADLRVSGQRGKRVLRELARRRFEGVADQPKRGFAIPVDDWVDETFRRTASERLLDPHSPVAEYLAPDVFTPWVTAFTRRELAPEISRGGLYQRVMMLVALDCTLRGQQ